jgi:hypothetical protein
VQCALCEVVLVHEVVLRRLGQRQRQLTTLHTHLIIMIHDMTRGGTAGGGRGSGKKEKEKKKGQD